MPISVAELTPELLAGIATNTYSDEELIITGGPISPEKSDALMRALTTNRTIKHVSLAGLGLTHANMEWLSAMLEHNRCLESLDISNNDFSEYFCMGAFAQTLGRNTTLTSLNLASTQQNSYAIFQICTALSTNRSTALQELELANNNFESISAEDLASLLSTNRSLVYLGLSNNKIYAEGVQRLSVSLIENRTLACLDLRLSRAFTSNQPGLRLALEGIHGLTTALRYNDCLQDILLDSYMLAPALNTALQSNRKKVYPTALAAVAISFVRAHMKSPLRTSILALLTDRRPKSIYSFVFGEKTPATSTHHRVAQSLAASETSTSTVSTVTAVPVAVPVGTRPPSSRLFSTESGAAATTTTDIKHIAPSRSA